MVGRFPWLWDTELDNAEFEAILRGRRTTPVYDFRWALLRLIEYAPYRDIRRLLRREQFLKEWPQLAHRVRSKTRREGMEFFHQWISQHPPRND
jgi:hypothetical protein